MRPLNWLVSLLRMAGTVSPFTAWLVQADGERQSRAVDARLRALEDPYSQLHPEVQEVGRLLYVGLQQTDGSRVRLDDATMQRYARVLAILRSAGCVAGAATIGGGTFVNGVQLSEPTFILYLCALFEDSDLMPRFIERLDKTPPRTWLHGAELSYEFALPLAVVRAVFELYESQGLGILSRELGTANYYTLV